MFSTLQHKVMLRRALGYLAVPILVIGIGVLAGVQLGQIRPAITRVTGILPATWELSNDIIRHALAAGSQANRYIRTQSQDDLDQFETEFADLRGLLEQADRRLANPEQEEMLDRIELAVEAYGNAFAEVTQLVVKRFRLKSEVLDVQALAIKSKLAAIRVQAIALNNPAVFLGFANAQDTFQLMLLGTSKYLEEGDERYVVLVTTSHQQAKVALSRLESILQDPSRRRDCAEARAAADAYYEGFQDIRAGYASLKSLYKTKLDVLLPRISSIALEIETSVDRETISQNELSQTLISRTQLVLGITTAFAALAGLGLGVAFIRRIRDRELAEQTLRQAYDRLEIRVKERTADLRTANEQLQKEIAERKRTEAELRQEKDRLEDALARVKKLSGLLPICASCKKIRDDQGYWNQIEEYIHKHSEAEFSHGLCPECAEKLYPGFINKDRGKHE